MTLASRSLRAHVAVLACVAVGCGGQTTHDAGSAGPASGTATQDAGATEASTGNPALGDGAPPVDAGGTSDSEHWTEVSEEELDALLENACTGSSIECESLAPSVQIVVDLSAGQARTAPNDSRSNWELTRQALKNLIPTLPASRIGVSFFPNRATEAGDAPAPSDRCLDASLDVPLAPLDQAQLAAIDAALSRVEPRSNAGSPLHDALQSGFAALEDVAGERPLLLLLVTEGAPSLSLGCVGSGSPEHPVSPDPIIDVIRAAHQSVQNSITTTIIGTPGSAATITGQDARSWLSLAARAGTSPDICGCIERNSASCHVDMTAGVDVGKAVRDQVVPRCNVLGSQRVLLPEGEAIDRTYVIYRSADAPPRLVRESHDVPCTTGWHWTDDGKTQEICPDTLALIACDPSARIDWVHTCNE